MRFILLALLIILSVAIQSSIQPFVSQRFIIFDLPVLITIGMGVFVSPFAGCVAGFATGLFQDLSTGTIVGLGALSFTITGYLAGVIEQNIKAEERFALAVLFFAMTVLKYVFSGFLIGLAGLGFKPLPYFYMSILPAIMNGIILLLLIKPISLLSLFKLSKS